jgi:hypothetical protein
MMQDQITLRVSEVKALMEDLEKHKIQIAELRRALEQERDKVDDANTNVIEY